MSKDKNFRKDTNAMGENRFLGVRFLRISVLLFGLLHMMAIAFIVSKLIGVGAWTWGFTLLPLAMCLLLLVVMLYAAWKIINYD